MTRRNPIVACPNCMWTGAIDQLVCSKEDEVSIDIMQKAHEAGDIIALDDGYYYFWNGGGLSAQNLRDIADGLDLLNAEWDAQVQKEAGE